LVIRDREDHSSLMETFDKLKSLGMKEITFEQKTPGRFM